MTDTITACENVCRDFSWVVPFASVLADIGTFIVGVGVIAAFRQFSVWRQQTLSHRRAEVAERILATAHEAAFALNAVRSPMESVPADANNHEKAILDAKLNRLASYERLFEDLRRCQVLAKAFFDDAAIVDGLGQLFSVRQSLLAAIGTLSVHQTVSERDGSDTTHREFYENLRMSLYRFGVKKDQLSADQDRAVSMLEDELIPFIRLDSRSN